MLKIWMLGIAAIKKFGSNPSLTPNKEGLNMATILKSFLFAFFTLKTTS
jgi:hypothetical protein